MYCQKDISNNAGEVIHYAISFNTQKSEIKRNGHKFDAPVTGTR